MSDSKSAPKKFSAENRPNFIKSDAPPKESFAFDIHEQPLNFANRAANAKQALMPFSSNAG